MKLQADIINGIYEVSDFEFPPISEDDFCESLNDKSNYEIICATVSDKTAEKLKQEYGINTHIAESGMIDENRSIEKFIVKNGIAVARIIDDYQTLKSGDIVRYSHLRVNENINASRDYNLVNAITGKISTNKKWSDCFNLPEAIEINNGMDNEFYLDV